MKESRTQISKLREASTGTAPDAGPPVGDVDAGGTGTTCADCTGLEFASASSGTTGEGWGAAGPPPTFAPHIGQNAAPSLICEPH